MLERDWRSEAAELFPDMFGPDVSVSVPRAAPGKLTPVFRSHSFYRLYRMRAKAFFWMYVYKGYRIAETRKRTACLSEAWLEICFQGCVNVGR